MTQAYLVDAFTDIRFEGNRAGVFLNGDDFTTKQKQQLAAEIGASETAFVGKSQVADYKVEFFTPTNEIDFCGHATIAVFHTLARFGYLNVTDKPTSTSEETRAGIVPISIQQTDGRIVIEMTQRSPQFAEVTLTPLEVATSLAISSDDLDHTYPIKLANTGVWHLIVGVKSREILNSIDYNPQLLSPLLSGIPVSTAHVFSAAGNNIFCARNFAPHIGIPEDPATGAAAGAFCAYLSHFGLFAGVDAAIEIRQGEQTGRPGEIRARICPASGEVKVAGSAVTAFLLVDPRQQDETTRPAENRHTLPGR